jgi:hypothetical protein
MDDISLLNFICEREFYLRPNWTMDENDVNVSPT